MIDGTRHLYLQTRRQMLEAESRDEERPWEFLGGRFGFLLSL